MFHQSSPVRGLDNRGVVVEPNLIQVIQQPTDVGFHLGDYAGDSCGWLTFGVTRRYCRGGLADCLPQVFQKKRFADDKINALQWIT